MGFTGQLNCHFVMQSDRKIEIEQKNWHGHLWRPNSKFTEMCTYKCTIKKEESKGVICVCTSATGLHDAALHEHLGFRRHLFKGRHEVLVGLRGRLIVAQLLRLLLLAFRKRCLAFNQRRSGGRGGKTKCLHLEARITSLRCCCFPRKKRD